MDRAEQELDILEKVGHILGSSREPGQAFQNVVSVLGEQLNIRRAALLLWDEATDRLQTTAAIGLKPEEIHQANYAACEGIPGQVIATGQPKIVYDIRQHGGFLKQADASVKTSSRHASQSDGPVISSLCIPIKDGEHLLGAISIDRPYVDQMSLGADTRLLTIVAAMIGQTIRIHQLVQLEKDQWLEENRRLRDDLLSKYQFDNIIGTSPAIMDLLAMIGQVASTRATCLLVGETGCGKELIAKAIHYNSPRNEKPLIRVNCSALNHHLLESELFGHVKGAFTGAVRDKIGRFEAADGGTIFLDEIGTMPLELQVKLLRVLQEREIERVGDHRTVKLNVRVIAATNLDLEQEVRMGTFREDLYYRLNVVTLKLPPLRTRREDTPLLIDHFLQRYNRENNRDLRKVSRDVLNTLMRYPWPGNIRELENTIERAVVLSRGNEFTEDLLPLQIRLYAKQVRGDPADESIEAIADKLANQAIRQRQSQTGDPYNYAMDQVQRQLIRQALDQNDGVKTRAADFLGINRNTLNKKVKELGVTG